MMMNVNMIRDLHIYIRNKWETQMIMILNWKMSNTSWMMKALDLLLKALLIKYFRTPHFRLKKKRCLRKM
jgi:hypothetical protein